MQDEHLVTEFLLGKALEAAATAARNHAAACLADSRHLPPSERSALLADVSNASALADRLATYARSHGAKGGTDR